MAKVVYTDWKDRRQPPEIVGVFLEDSAGYRAKEKKEDELKAEGYDTDEEVLVWIEDVEIQHERVSGEVEFECNFCKEYYEENESEDLPIAACLWLENGTHAVEYNLCYDKQAKTNSSAIYKMNAETQDTFHTIYEHYEVDFSDDQWEEKLKNAMEVAARRFWEPKVNFDKLAIAVINEFESEREESGRKELVKGLKYLWDKYQSSREKEIVSETLVSLTGWSLDSLLEKSEEISDDEVEEW